MASSMPFVISVTDEGNRFLDRCLQCLSQHLSNRDFASAMLYCSGCKVNRIYTLCNWLAFRPEFGAPHVTLLPQTQENTELRTP